MNSNSSSQNDQRSSRSTGVKSSDTKSDPKNASSRSKPEPRSDRVSNRAADTESTTDSDRSASERGSGPQRQDWEDKETDDVRFGRNNDNRFQETDKRDNPNT